VSSASRNHLLAVILALSSVVGLVNPASAGSSPNPCVGIASDSNGYGHVTFQLGPEGDVGIIYVRPLWLILQEELRKIGLGDLKVIDRSLSAGGLTSSQETNYLKSIPYGNLTNDRCKFVIVGPFLPDVAAGKAQPAQYTGQLLRLVNGLLDKSENSTIFVLNFYQTRRAEFTEHNAGVGLTPERLRAFNAQIASACRPDGSIGRYPQVLCADTQTFFEDMDTPYVLAETTQAQYEALVYRQTAFMARVDSFFQANPDGALIGDGIHLSLAGRERLMQRMAEWISRLMPM
jgi:hypothetical protein